MNFKSIYLSSNTSLLIKTGTITINTFLLTRNKFVYSCSIKIHALGFDEHVESIFCLLLIVEAFSLEKVVRILEEAAVSWREVRWIWQMRQDFIAQFIQLLKRSLCDMQLDVVMEKNWALAVDRCQLQVLQFSVYLTDFLSILLSCNGLTRIQKTVVGQTGSRPTKSDYALFGCMFGFGKWFEVSSWSNHRAIHNQLLYKIHFSSHIKSWLRNGPLLLFRRFLFICSQLMRHPLMGPFHLPNLLQILNDHGMVDIEFLGSFLCSCKGISFW